MAPASIVARLSNQLVAGYQSYGFQVDGSFPEVVNGILRDPTPDYPGSEFYIGGKIVKDMSDGDFKKLESRGVTLDRDPRRLIEVLSEKFIGGK
jgi:CRISPR-associated protein Cst2